MKKLKLRGKEIKRLGYESDKAISCAINITNKYFKKNQKIEVLETLEKISLNPSDYINDKIFSSLAKLLVEKPKPTIKSNKIKFEANKQINYKIFGREGIDEQTIQQMDAAMKLPISIEGALMPDAHVGYGLPIGGVLSTYNAIIPYAVGMDIGCRMCMSLYHIPPNYIDKNRILLKNILIENTRFGKAEFNDIKENEVIDRKEFTEIKFLKGLKNKAFSQLGTSGGGNHFVDIGYIKIHEDILKYDIPKGTYFAILSHSGSRGMGADIARYYTNIAKKKRMMPKGTTELAWLELTEEEGIEYWKAMNLAGDYSSANHQIIHNKLSKALGFTSFKQIENHHNFAWMDNISINEKIITHRKGATPAYEGILGIIPGSMATPGFLVIGKGYKESLNSASHGAGRLLSRAKAKSNISKKSLLQTMKKSGIELLGGDTDEAPEAYKDIFKVMDHQKNMVEIIGTFYPKIVRMN